MPPHKPDLHFHRLPFFASLRKSKLGGPKRLPIMASEPAATVVLAPARPALDSDKIKKSVFLAGTTSQTGDPDWRQTLIEALAGYPIAIFNPKRDDWDSTWREDFSDSRWEEQVEWELEMQDKADIVVVFFHPVSPAPVSLLELGLCVRSRRAIVCALEGYAKRGNVEAVCRRYDATFVDSERGLRAAVIARLEQDLRIGGKE